MRKLFFTLLIISFGIVASAQSTGSDEHTPIIDPPASGPCGCVAIKDGITAGPLNLKFSANPVSNEGDHDWCYYVANDASLTMSMDGQINRHATFENNVKVTFARNCRTKKLSGVKVDWAGDLQIPDLFIKIPGIAETIKIFNLAVRKLSLAVDINGNLSGSVTIHVTNQDDRDLTWNKKVVMLRKGTNSDITFSFNNTNSFKGSFDFSGIHGINIDLCKQDDKGNEIILASFKDGNFDKDGTLTGQFVMEGNNTPSYTSNLFRITLLFLKLGLEMKIPEVSFRLTKGSGKVRIADMKHVTGTIDLGLNFPGYGCVATVEASKVSAFTMTLDQLKAQADFNEYFDMTQVRGSLKAKHDKFDAAIDVSDFWVKNGSLEKFSCSGKVKYSGFEFVLEQGTYVPVQLTIKKASVKISATGADASFAVGDFRIQEDGSVSVGSIEGNLNKGPAEFSFSAAFETTRFKGTFKGAFAGIGLEGKVDIGAKPDYNFAYLEAKAKSNVGIPIGNSGLKLTSVGGRVGYNYFLPNIRDLGNPQKGSYIVGLALGVADAANMCEVEGTTVVQFSRTSFVIDLQGDVTVLKNNKFFTGSTGVKYTYPDQTLSGFVSTDLKIPGSGWVFKSKNLRINFDFGNNKFKANGNNMGGDMFGGKIELTNGKFNLSGDLSDASSLKGSMGGKASAAFSYSVSKSFWGNDISGSISLKMNSDMSIDFDQNGMTGGFDITVSGDGSLSVENAIFEKTISGSAECSGTVTYNGGTLTLTGKLYVYLPISIPVWYAGDWTPTWTNEFSTGTVSISF